MLPDWSYHTLFKPLLRALSPYHSREFIHSGMNLVASLPGGNHLIHFLGRNEESPHLQKKLNQIPFPNAIGLSGKIDPLLSGTEAFSNLGFGFLEIGPVTKTKIEGETPKIDYKHEMIEFPSRYESIGLEHTIHRLKNFQKKQPLLIRLSGDMKELNEMISALDAFADAFILESNSYIESLKTPFTTITEKPVYISIPINQIKNISLENIQLLFSGIVLEEDPNDTDKINLSKLKEAILYLRENHFMKTIITVGGVREPADAMMLFDAKVDLIMLSSGYVFSGPGLPKRIKEAQLFRMDEMEVPISGWGWYFLFGFSIFIGGIIAFIISMTAIILSYDEFFLGMSRKTIFAFNERILHFMSHDRMTLAGTMISGGIIYMFLAKYGIRKGLLWAKQATDIAAIVGFLGIFLFIGYGYFDWLHLIFWFILLPFYLLGFMNSRNIKGSPSSPNLRNHKLWKRSLIGQFLFIVLGFSFVLGGIIISIVAISKVFVETDLSYISMAPNILHLFNDRLIPVIAHDRAGFGSALLSVGLLVLMISLWGFQEGNMWIWWTLLLGGIPAFVTGIGVHFVIGYKDFIHLLPAYFALGLYIIGLFITYSFFNRKKDEI